MARAIDTPSLMTSGDPYDCSSTTFLPAEKDQRVLLACPGCHQHIEGQECKTQMLMREDELKAAKGQECGAQT